MSIFGHVKLSFITKITHKSISIDYVVIQGSVLALLSETTLLGAVKEFSLNGHFRSMIKHKNEAVSTIQRDPEKKLVRCVKHDPSHKIQDIDVSYFGGYFL